MPTSRPTRTSCTPDSAPRLRSGRSSPRTACAYGLVTRYEDVRMVLADPRLSKDLNTAGDLFRKHTAPDRLPRAVGGTVARHMLSSDPPVHSRLRKLVGRAFGTRPVEAMEPKVERTSARLLDALAGRTELDVIGQYAFPPGHHGDM